MLRKLLVIAKLLSRHSLKSFLWFFSCHYTRQIPSYLALLLSCYPAIESAEIRKDVDYFCVVHETGRGLFSHAKGRPKGSQIEPLPCSPTMLDKIIDLVWIMKPKCWLCFHFLPMIWTDMLQCILRFGLVIVPLVRDVTVSCILFCVLCTNSLVTICTFDFMCW